MGSDVSILKSRLLQLYLKTYFKIYKSFFCLNGCICVGLSGI
jgi:hypothetical protein